MAGEAYAQAASGGEGANPFQAKIDAAASGGTVEIEPGIYSDAVLTIGKPLTLTSVTGQPGAAVLTGQSRIVVNSSNVVIAGLSFRDSGCMPGGAAPAPSVEILAGADRSGIVVKSSAFRDTCGAAVQTTGGGAIGIEITGNTLVNIGLDAPGPASHPGRADRPGMASELAGVETPAGVVDVAAGPGGDASRVADAAILLAGGADQGRVSGEISGNHIEGTAAAGIVAFNAGGMRIFDNYISDTPASAVVLARGAGPGEVRVYGNTVVNASNGPRAPASGAAITVWADGDNVGVTGNTIRASGGAFAVCAGACADGAGGTGTAADAAEIKMWFTGNTVYAHEGPNNAGGVLVRNNAAGTLNALNNYFVGIVRDDTGAVTSGSVNLGDLPPVSPDPVPAYDAYRVTGTVPVDNFGIWNMAFDATNDRLYLGTDPMEGSDHPGGSSIVYAYDMSGAVPSLLGSWNVGGTGGRIADMEANPETGQVHVLHAWLDNDTANTIVPGVFDWNWYRGGHGWDSPETLGGWGLRLTTLDGADMSSPNYTARLQHTQLVENRSLSVQVNNYSLFPRNVALEAELEVATKDNLLFASTVLGSPIAVLNNSADSPAFMMGTNGNDHASYVSAMAVNASGPAITAYAADGDWTNLRLSVVRFNANYGSGASIENYERMGQQLDAGARADPFTNTIREIVLDDAADRLFVLWYDTQKVSMYALDTVGSARNAAWHAATGTVGIPVFVKDLEGTDSPLGDYGARDMSLDEDAGILYTVVRDYTDPRVVAHNTTTGALLGSASLSNEPVSVEVGKNGDVYAASQQWPNVYVIEPQPASDLQRMIDAVPAADAHHVAETIATAGTGASHLAVDAARGVAYLGTLDDPPAVLAYNLSDGSPLGSYAVGGRSARIVDMEANAATGQVHVMHTWLANDTINTLGDWTWNWYRGGHGGDGPTRGGWGLNVTTLGSGMGMVHADRLEHNYPGQGRVADLFPALEVRSAGLEVDAGRGLLFAWTNVYSPIAVMNVSATEREFNSMSGSGHPQATHVTAVAVNTTGGPVVTAYAAGVDQDNTNKSLIVVQFNSEVGGARSVENYAKVGGTLVATGGDQYTNTVRDLVLDDRNDRLFVAWRNNDTVSMYSLDDRTVTVGGQSIGIPVFMKNLEGTGAPLDGVEPYDKSLVNTQLLYRASLSPCG